MPPFVAIAFLIFSQVLPGDVLRAVTERVEDESEYLERKYLQYVQGRNNEETKIEENAAVEIEEEDDEEFEDAREDVTEADEEDKILTVQLRKRCLKTVEEHDDDSSSGFGSNGSSSEGEEASSS